MVYSKKGIEIFSFPQGHVPRTENGKGRQETGERENGERKENRSELWSALTVLMQKSEAFYEYINFLRNLTK